LVLEALAAVGFLLALCTSKRKVSMDRLVCPQLLALRAKLPTRVSRHGYRQQIECGENARIRSSDVL
jgi:hypothetical protein